MQLAHRKNLDLAPDQLLVREELLEVPKPVAKDAVRGLLDPEHLAVPALVLE